MVLYDSGHYNMVLCGTTSGPHWDHFGTTLWPFWDNFGTIMRTILGPFWDPSYFDLLLLKRGPKAPKRARRAPQPSAGARRKGAERPELLVYQIQNFFAYERYSNYLLNPRSMKMPPRQTGNFSSQSGKFMLQLLVWWGRSWSSSCGTALASHAEADARSGVQGGVHRGGVAQGNQKIGCEEAQ